MVRSGIYAITCTISGKIYVGSSVDIPRRWAAHRKALRCGTHHSILLQRAWDKYGELSFKFEILEHIEDRSRLVSTEQKWLDSYNANDPSVGFNICPKAGSSLGTIPSKEARRKISEANKGKSKTQEWRQKISDGNKGKLKSKEARQKNAYSNSKDWVVTDPNGVVTHVRNLYKFCREHGLNTTQMYRVSNGDTLHHRGWTCQRVVPKNAQRKRENERGK